MRNLATKAAALASDPVQYLTHFGETEPLSEQTKALAEKYLLRVKAEGMSTATAERFDQLRIENYASSSAGNASLPPSSSVLEDTSTGESFWCTGHSNCLQQLTNARQYKNQ